MHNHLFMLEQIGHRDKKKRTIRTVWNMKGVKIDSVAITTVAKEAQLIVFKATITATKGTENKRKNENIDLMRRKRRNGNKAISL